tara:strand:- start:270 stop:668 length:399 start_codon:yes stop_codon:yes gene_type:complete
MADDSTYSLLSLFLILNQNLIDDNNEVSILFNHLLENNKFDNEIKSLLIYKKALFDSNFANESELLKTLQPILNSEDNLWRPHALLLIGDYFSSKKEHIKAKEFYMQVLSIKNLDRDLYYQASSQIELNNND